MNLPVLRNRGRDVHARVLGFAFENGRYIALLDIQSALSTLNSKIGGLGFTIPPLVAQGRVKGFQHHFKLLLFLGLHTSR